jgi:hypothetical protein
VALLEVARHMTTCSAMPPAADTVVWARTSLAHHRSWNFSYVSRLCIPYMHTECTDTECTSLCMYAYIQMGDHPGLACQVK